MARAYSPQPCGQSKRKRRPELEQKIFLTPSSRFLIAAVEATLDEIKSSIVIQNEGFENLVRGTEVTMKDVLERAPSNWYLEAQEALSLGLVSGVV
jgi:hypothetical protein